MRVARGARGRAGLLAGCLLGACAAGAPTGAQAQEAHDGRAGPADQGEAGKGEAAKAEAGEDGKAGEEEGPARPPLPPPPPSRRLPWGRHIEIGGDVALAARPASTLSDGTASSVRYRPVIGFGVHARWELLRVLRFSAYFVDADHELTIPPGALGVAGEVESGPAETIAFGARFAPTLPLGERARAWVSAGIGWGRFKFDRMTISEPGAGGSFEVRERSMSFAEVPIGLGASFDVIRNWLTIELEVSGAFTFGQEGEALERAQAIDTAGRRRSIGALPKIDGSFVQTLGLSLVL